MYAGDMETLIQEAGVMVKKMVEEPVINLVEALGHLNLQVVPLKVLVQF